MKPPYERTVPGAESAPGMDFFLIFLLDDRRYAVALESVERVVRAFAPAPLPEGPTAVLGLLNVHGRVIPLLDLRHIFGLPGRELRPGDYFVITAGPAGTCAVAADSVPGLTGFRPDELLPAEAAVRGRYVDRVIKAPDGLILIFDPARLLPREELISAAAPGGPQWAR